MFTIGITRAAGTPWSPSCSSFKDDYDNNQPAVALMRRFLRAHPAYREQGPRRAVRRDPRRLPRQRHRPPLTTEMYLSEMVPAMTPADAYAG